MCYWRCCKHERWLVPSLSLRLRAVEVDEIVIRRGAFIHEECRAASGHSHWKAYS